jgi:hypothetical protein
MEEVKNKRRAMSSAFLMANAKWPTQALLEWATEFFTKNPAPILSHAFCARRTESFYIDTTFRALL